MNYLQKEADKINKVIIEMRVAVPNKDTVASFVQICPTELNYFLKNSDFKQNVLNNLLKIIKKGL